MIIIIIRYVQPNDLADLSTQHNLSLHIIKIWIFGIWMSSNINRSFSNHDFQRLCNSSLLWNCVGSRKKNALRNVSSQQAPKPKLKQKQVWHITINTPKPAPWDINIMNDWFWDGKLVAKCMGFMDPPWKLPTIPAFKMCANGSRGLQSKRLMAGQPTPPTWPQK